MAHVHEVLQLMSALTKDRRFETAGNEFRKGENLSMCEILDEVENRGIQKGLAQGISIGEARGEAKAAKNYESVLAEKDAKYVVQMSQVYDQMRDAKTAADVGLALKSFLELLQTNAIETFSKLK